MMIDAAIVRARRHEEETPDMARAMLALPFASARMAACFARRWQQAIPADNDEIPMHSASMTA